MINAIPLPAIEGVNGTDAFSKQWVEADNKKSEKPALWRGEGGKTAGGIEFALIFWFFWIKPKEHKKKCDLG